MIFIHIFLLFVSLQMGFSKHRISLSDRCALTTPFHPYRYQSRYFGGLFSLALSIESLRPVISRHLTLRSSDFPPLIKAIILSTLVFLLFMFIVYSIFCIKETITHITYKYFASFINFNSFLWNYSAITTSTSIAIDWYNR